MEKESRISKFTNPQTFSPRESKILAITVALARDSHWGNIKKETKQSVIILYNNFLDLLICEGKCGVRGGGERRE